MASFNINYPGSPNQFVVNAGSTIKTKGGIFNGNEREGDFSLKTLIGAVKGSYKILSATGAAETIVAVTILKKPMIVPMSKIQEVISSYF